MVASENRLLHHSPVLNIGGDSYRLPEQQRAGFFAAPPAGQEVMSQEHQPP